MQEFCLAEMAVATEVSVIRVHLTTAEVLDLRHRPPRLWIDEAVAAAAAPAAGLRAC